MDTRHAYFVTHASIQRERGWMVCLDYGGCCFRAGPFGTEQAAIEYADRLTLALDEADGGDPDRYVYVEDLLDADWLSAWALSKAEQRAPV